MPISQQGWKTGPQFWADHNCVNAVFQFSGRGICLLQALATGTPSALYCPSFRNLRPPDFRCGRIFLMLSKPMTETPSDELLRKILRENKVFACVGVSPNPIRPSHYVGRYLKLKGYRVIPVNPVQAGKTLFGETVQASLSEVSTPVDVIDIFRRPEAVPEIVEEALAMAPRPKVIWMQIGVTHPQAAARAEAEGLVVIQNRCPKIEYQRLFGELRMGGFNTGIISSKL